ncbi:MAG: hypothetical protein RJA09_1106 [Pseudomonadota bacterium]|jgi:hypothetical protein
MDLTAPPVSAMVLPMPPGARPLDVGAGRQPWWFNGQWMSVSAFHATQSVPDLLHWYQRVLGGQWVQREQQGRYILSKVQGAEHWTIQLQAAPGAEGVGGPTGTRGWLAVQRHAGPLGSQSSGHNPQLPAVSPEGSRVLSHLRTQDGPRAAEHLVWTNTLGTTTNTRWLQTHLAGRGFVFERQSPFGATTTLWFGGPRREATAVLTQEPSGLSTVVLQVAQIVPIKVPLPPPKGQTP